MLTDDDDVTPPPRRPPAPYGMQPVVLTPESNISMPLWRFIAVLALVVSGAIALWTGYSRLQDTLRTQGEHIAAIDTRLARLDEARLLELARSGARAELGRATVECPRAVTRGAQVSCHITLGAVKDE